jgi:hypothetical protein
MTHWCDPFGWERSGGPRAAGGLVTDPIDDRSLWRCGRPADHRFRGVCAHGHELGEDLWLCELCYWRLRGRVPGWTFATPFKTGLLVPCPRCQVTDPRRYPVPEYVLSSDHKCQLRLEPVS